MDDILYIEIIIFNMKKRLKIDISTKELKLIVDGNIKKITKEDINNLCEIIKYWDVKYVDFILDSEKYSIKFMSNNKIIKSYYGSGKYPYNYLEFKKWISDIS